MNIYGASGHAKVIIDIIRSKDLALDFIFDDNPEIKELLGLKVIHEITENIWEKNWVLAIGSNKTRKILSQNFKASIHPALVHKKAVISPSVKLGKGTVVMANACINSSAYVGEHCIINTGAVIEHDCKLEDFVHISPNAVLAGDVMVGEGSHIGSGVAVIPGIRIGKWSIIGAGTVIIKDVPEGVVVVGNPGRIIKNIQI